MTPHFLDTQKTFSTQNLQMREFCCTFAASFVRLCVRRTYEHH